VTPQRLRRLTLNPLEHPQGRSQISAASGLVCTHGRAWVVGDDEQHLASFNSRTAPGELHRLLPGDLPADNAERKKRKADFETLLWWPETQSLVALGSGSAPNRERGVAVPISNLAAPQVFNLAPLFEPLREQLGRINIEGAFCWQEHVLLLNRGHAQGGPNAVARYRSADVAQLMQGRLDRLAPQSLQTFDLGAIGNAQWGFTDGTALPDGSGWLFWAAAEASANSVADGVVRGAALGWVNAQGQLAAWRQLDVPHKVEGIDIQQRTEGLWVFMVTDADNPREASWLLGMKW
jgi:hypothetical protein